MGYKDTQEIAGFRFQKYDSGEVHVHDDKNSVKFIHKDATRFKSDAEQALKDLAQVDDGAAIIEGEPKGPDLMLIKTSNGIQVFVKKKDSEETKFKKFLKGL